MRNRFVDSTGFGDIATTNQERIYLYHSVFITSEALSESTDHWLNFLCIDYATKFLKIEHLSFCFLKNVYPS